MKKSIFIFAAATFFNAAITAQVTIGADKEPINGALLDLKNKPNDNLNPASRQDDDLVTANRGLAFPRVKLTAYNVITLEDVSTELDKLKATGIVVYNTNPNADGVIEGLVQWNGSEWLPLGGIAPKASIFGIDCDDIVINGIYVKNRPLTAGKNTMVLPVNVSRKGSYNLRVAAVKGNGSDESNGYVFAAKGEFASDGKILVTLEGQGTPSLAYNDYVEGNEISDVFDIYLNDKLVSCSAAGTTYTRPAITNKVLDVLPEYTFSCSNKKVSTAFNVKQQVASTDNVMLYVTSDVSGAEYHIYTPEINGVYFEARGTLLKGTQQIFLQANGTPKAGGVFDYVIRHNSVKDIAECNFTVTVSYTAFKIQVYGSSGWADGLYGDTQNRTTLVKVTSNPNVFGLGQNYNAPIVVSNIAVNGANSSGTTSIPAGTNMVFVSYSSTPDVNMSTALSNYAKNGGFVIYSVEDENSLNRIANALYGVSNAAGRGFTIADQGFGMDLMPCISGNHLVNGLYANLTGKYLGRDGGFNRGFTITDSNKWVGIVGSSGSTFRAIMSKQYNVVLVGDGGFFSGGIPGYTEDSSAHPARVDASGNPIPATYGSYTPQGAYNSHFMVNLIMWAIEETNNR